MRTRTILYTVGLSLLLCGCQSNDTYDITANNDIEITVAPSNTENSDDEMKEPPKDLDYKWVVEEFNAACALEDEGKYAEAYDKFLQIKDYIDIDEVIVKCNYYRGIDFMNTHEFDKARECFLSSEDYEDSSLYLTYLDVYEEFSTKYEMYDTSYKFNQLIHISIPIEDAEPTLSAMYGEWVNEKNSKDKFTLSEKYLNEKEYKVIACVSLNGLPLDYIYLSYAESSEDVLSFTYNSELNIIQREGNIYKRNKKVSPTFEISGDYTTSNDGMPISTFKHSIYNLYEMTITGLADISKTELEIPSQVGPFKVTALKDTALENCNNITSVILPSTITRIGNRSMSECDKLSEIKLSKNLLTIGDESIVDTQIKKISIPKKLESIGKDTLTNNKKLTTITVNEKNKNFASVDGVLYSKDMTTLIVYPAGKTDKKFTLPATVTKISSKAFYNNKYIEKITFPEGLKTLDDSTLVGCTSLKKLIFQGNTTIINNELFKGTSNLTLEGPYDADDIKDYAKTKKFKVELAEKPEVIEENPDEVDAEEVNSGDISDGQIDAETADTTDTSDTADTPEDETQD